jgi:hypothetical protein
MGTGQLPIVSRGQLDALSNRLSSLRERSALAQHLTGTATAERACSLLLRRVMTAADTVSREDFLAVSAWQPLLASAFLGTYLAMSSAILEQSHALRHVRLPKSKREEALHEPGTSCTPRAISPCSAPWAATATGLKRSPECLPPARVLVCLHLEHRDPVHRARGVGDRAAR